MQLLDASKGALLTVKSNADTDSRPQRIVMVLLTFAIVLAPALRGRTAQPERLAKPVHTGLRITAYETSEVMDGNAPIRAFLSNVKSNSLGSTQQAAVKQLEARLGQSSGSTPIQTSSEHTYVWSAERIEVKTTLRDFRSNVVEDFRATASDQIIANSTLDLRGSVPQTERLATGNIYKPTGQWARGYPYFLTLETIGLLLDFPPAEAPAGVEAMLSETAVFKVSVSTSDPAQVFTVFLDASRIPIGLATHSPEGVLTSFSRLYFDRPTEDPVCTRAEISIYSGGRLFEHRLWKRTSSEAVQEALFANISEVLPIGTLVSDHRFEKPLSYLMGERLPNDAEIKLLLSDPRGVQKYHSATFPAARVQERSRSSSKWTIGVVRALLSLSAIGGILLIWRTFGGPRPKA